MTSGVIFDLDGTLVDSRLDFEGMRRDLGFEAGAPILEAIAAIDDPVRRARCYDIILDHEFRGAQSATLMPGVRELLADLEMQGVRTAIFTRNARIVTNFTLRRFDLDFEHVVAREDAPPKPDPSGLRLICDQWHLQPSEVVYIGDYLFDLQAGERAGIRTILYAPSPADFPHDAEYVISHFSELPPLLKVRQRDEAV